MNVSIENAIVFVPVTTYETQEVEQVTINLASPGERRRFHRLILAGAANVEGTKSEAFANALVEAIGATPESAAKQ